MRRALLGAVLAGAAGAVAIAVHVRFDRDLRAAHARLAGRSAMVSTPDGALEYARAGSGAPFLMIHGTGGGFDQGLAFAEGLLGFEVLAPSRFGYLRSDFPPDPSSERQADAFAVLLDRLGIARIAVAGGSAGALSAVQFALRHPQRTRALVLIVPAANVHDRDPVRMTPIAEFLVRRLTTSDFLFWAAARTRRDAMIGTLLATDPALVERAPAPERERAYRILDEILPVSQRWRGMLNDARLAGHPAHVDFSTIRVPTLVVSVDDDRFGTADTAREIAAAVPGARLVIYPSGGHIWVGHDAELWREVAQFVRAHD